MSYDYSFIGSEIRRIRKSRKISQRDLADMVGISEESLRRIENNHNNPRVDSFIDILEVLGIDFEIVLMDDSGSSWYLVNQQLSIIDNDLENLNLADLSKNIEKLQGFREGLPSSYHTKLDQFIFYYKAIYEKDINKDIDKFKEYLLEALKINGKPIEEGFSAYYSAIEKRILIKLSELGLSDFNSNSKEILDYLVDNMEIAEIYYIDVLYNLGKYYYMHFDFSEAIRICNQALNLSSQTNNYKRIILIYYLIGISKYKLKDETYMEDIEKSLILCDLLLKPELKIIIKHSVEKILKES